MTAAESFLEIARRPDPETIAGRAAALAEGDAALDALDAARRDLGRQIAEGDAARRTLLLDASPTGTQKLVSLNARLAETRVELERLDEIEPLLVARCRRLANAQREAEADAVAEAYNTALDRWRDCMHAAIAARGHLVGIRDIAVRAGHEALLGSLDLPHPHFPHDAEAIATFISGAKGRVAHIRGRTRAEPEEVVPMRFLKAYGVWRTGETAGFSPQQAWLLYDHDVATWASPKRRPARMATREA